MEVPPTAYEQALSNVCSHVNNLKLDFPATATTPSPGDNNTTAPAKGERPKIVFYKAGGGGEPGRLSRRVEQIVLYSSAPPKYNNANNDTLPDFRTGLAARYFDIATHDVSNSEKDGVSKNEAPVVIVQNSKGEEVAKFSGASAESSRFYSTLIDVLKDEGVDADASIKRAAVILAQLYRVEIEIQKLEKRSGRNVERLLKQHRETMKVGLEKYQEALASLK